MRYNTKTITFVITFLAIFCLSMQAMLIAAQSKPLKQTVLSDRQVTGELLAKTPQNDPQMITIGVDSENADYMFYIAEDMNIVHKKSLSEIQIGDTVRVRYYVVQETDEKGRTYEKSIVQTVTFVRSPSTIKGLRSK